MATRWYLQNEAPGYTPATWKGAWTDVATPTLGDSARKLGLTKSGSRASCSVTKTVSSADHNVTNVRFISDALDAQTISGTVKHLNQPTEQNSTTDALLRCHIYVTVGDSDSVRGTLLANHQDTTEIQAGHSSQSARDFDGSPLTLSSVAVQAGDRLVVEFGHFNSYPGTGFSSNVRVVYGGTGDDLTPGSSNTASEAVWIEFSHDFGSGGGGGGSGSRRRVAIVA